MKCADVELLLVDDVRGELDAARAADVKAHVEQCAACRGLREEFAGTLGVLAEGFGEGRRRTVRLDDLHRGRIMLSRKRQVGVGRWLLRAAALVVVLGGLAGMLMPAMSSAKKMARVSARGQAMMLSCSEVATPQASAPADVTVDRYEANGRLDISKPEEALSGKNFSGTASSDGARGPSGVARLSPLPSPSADDSAGTPGPVEVKEISRRAKASAAPGVVRRDARDAGTRVDSPFDSGHDDGEAKADELVVRTTGGRKSSIRVYGGDAAEVGGLGMGSGSAGGLKDKMVAETPMLTEAAPGEHAQLNWALDSKVEPSKATSFKSPVVMKGVYASREGGRHEAKPKIQTPKEQEDFKREREGGGGEVDRLVAKRLASVPEGAKTIVLGVVPAPEPVFADADVVVEIKEEPVEYNTIMDAVANRFSTFAIDVDTASFTMARRALLSGSLPSASSVRVEEFINAFDQDYRPPEKRTFAVYTDRARSPFRPGLELLRIGVRGKVLGRDQQKPSVLTLVVDTSGSMNTPDRIGLMKRGIRMLVDGLGPNDRLAIVAFGAKASLVLDMTMATEKKAILAAVEGMETQGATHLEGGLRLGYEMAARHFGSGCLNRVILMSDGVANLGAATAGEILKQVENSRKQGIYCSVYGFGQGTYNDAMLESLADKGDGVYRFIDSAGEVKRAFVDDLSASFQVIARDVKIQVEFDSKRVKAYRQLGYENRRLTREQFRDDTVDAGEVGSGQSATALYEVELAGGGGDALGTVRVRWMDVATGQVQELAEGIRAGDRYPDFGAAPSRFRLTAGAAELAGVLRGDPISKATALGDIATVLRPVGMELSLDRQVEDLVKMVTAAMRLLK